MPIGPPSIGAPYTPSPTETSFQAPSLKFALTSLYPRFLRSTSASWTWKVGIRSASSITTSGAPLPAATAVWNLSYSSPPAPAFVQQTWTSLCWVLKLSTTFCMFGYQAHSVTTGACLFLMVLVQLADLLAPLPSSLSPPH